MRSFSAVVVASGIEAEHRDLAAVARPEPFEDFDGAGLAGAVRSEQAEHLAGKDLEVDAFDGGQRPVTLRQALDGDSNRHVVGSVHYTRRRGECLGN